MEPRSVTPAEKQKRAEDACTHIVAQMIAANLDKRADELAALLGKRWANLCIAVEGNIRRETAEKCADIAERWGDVQIRDEINEAFGLNNWSQRKARP